MPTLFIAMEESTIALGGLGGLIALLQILSMIFKRRGDQELNISELARADDLKALSAVAAANALSLGSIEARMVHHNTSFQQHVFDETMKHREFLDKIEDHDKMLRGNGGGDGHASRIKRLEEILAWIERKIEGASKEDHPPRSSSSSSNKP